MHLLQCIACMSGLNTTCSSSSDGIRMEFKQHLGKEGEGEGEKEGKGEGEGERTLLH